MNIFTLCMNIQANTPTFHQGWSWQRELCCETCTAATTHDYSCSPSTHRRLHLYTVTSK